MKCALSIITVIALVALSSCRSLKTNGSTGSGVVSTGSLVERINAEALGVVPSKPRNNSVFDVFNPANNEGGWSTGWTKAIDLSGVSWDGTRTATLVSPVHFVMADHYKRQVGDTVVFLNKREQKVVRQIEALKSVGSDIAVGLLNEAVPGTNYRVFRPSAELPVELIGALVFLTDGERRVHVHEIGGIMGGSVQFKHSDLVHKGYWENLIVGDSSNPAFVMFKGEPVLLETHTYGGAGNGAYYSSDVNVAAVNAAMSELGGGYQLRFAEH
jgi:hypothetical protein